MTYISLSQKSNPTGGYVPLSRQTSQDVDNLRREMEKIAKYNAMIEESWRAQEEASKAGSLWETIKETGKQIIGLGERKALGGMIAEPKKIVEAYKPVGQYIKAPFQEPKETAIGIAKVIPETIQFAQKILQPSVPQHEIFKEPETPEGQKARAIGDFLGWLVPYSAVAKGAKVGLEAITTAPKIAKYIPVISDAIGFIGTGQVLYEKEEDTSRLKQLRNDVILLGAFKAVGLGFEALRGKAVEKEIDTVIKDFKDITTGKPETIRLRPEIPDEAALGRKTYFPQVEGVPERPVKIPIKTQIDNLEKRVLQINETIKAETGKTPKEHIKEDITGEIKPKAKPSAAMGKKAQELGYMPSTPQEKALEKARQVKERNQKVAQELGYKPEITAKKVEVPQAQLPIGEGKLKVSRLEARIKGQLGKISETEKSGLSTFQEMSKPQQIHQAVEWVSKNPKEAMAVLRGEKSPPKGLLKNSIYVAMHNLAKGNTELALKLSTEFSSRAGQEISILTELDPHSPVKFITGWIKNRIELMGGKEKITNFVKTETKRISQAMKKAHITKDDFKAFIESIKC